MSMSTTHDTVQPPVSVTPGTGTEWRAREKLARVPIDPPPGPFGKLLTWVARRMYGQPLDNANAMARNRRVLFATFTYERRVAKFHRLDPCLKALAVMAVSAEIGCTWCIDFGYHLAVVGDGAVGLCAVLAAAQLGAPTIIAMSRHADRQALARRFGATHIVAERDEAGADAVWDLTGGIGADCVLECVGTEGSRLQAIGCVRDGGNIGLVGVPHGDLPMNDLFWRNVGVKGGPAHCRAYLPDLLELVWSGAIDPGPVFDLELPLAEVAEAYAAMDSRRAVKVLLRP